MAQIFLTTMLVASLMTSSIGEHVRVCYYGTWAIYRPKPGGLSPEKFDPFLCSHIILSFVKVDTTTYRVAFNDEDMEKRIQETTRLKEYNPALKVLVAVGGWNHGSHPFIELTSDDDYIKTFTKSVLDLLQKYDLDGFDIDWEYPVNEKRKFSRLLQGLRTKFNWAADIGKKHYLLTAAVAASIGTARISYDTSVMAKTLDYLFVMAYDMHGHWDSFTGHQSALRGDKDKFDVSSIAMYYKNDGMPHDRIVIGFPTYGRSHLLQDKGDVSVGAKTNAGRGPRGYYSGEQGSLTYYEICTQYLTSGSTYGWDDINKASYAYKDLAWVSFDSKQAICHKLSWLYKNRFKGWMIWALESDDHANICGEGAYPLTNFLKDNVGEFLSERDCMHDYLKPMPKKNRNIKTIPPYKPPKPIKYGPEPPTDFCEQKQDGQYPDKDDCRRFITCGYRKTYSKFCTRGLVFSAANSACDYPANVETSECTIYPIDENSQGPSTKKTSPTKSASPHSQATDKGMSPSATWRPTPPHETDYCMKMSVKDGIYMNPRYCGGYIQCISGITHSRFCPPGLLWNRYMEVCDVRSNVDCSRSGSKPKRTKRPTTTSTTSTKAKITRTRPQTDAMITGHCADREDGLYAHPTDCQSFVHCSNGRIFVKHCQNGLMYSLKLKACDWEKNVDCSRDDQPVPDKAMNTMTENDDGGLSKIGWVGTGLFIAFLVALMVAAIAFFVYRRNKPNSDVIERRVDSVKIPSIGILDELPELHSKKARSKSTPNTLFVRGERRMSKIRDLVERRPPLRLGPSEEEQRREQNRNMENDNRRKNQSFATGRRPQDRTKNLNVGGKRGMSTSDKERSTHRDPSETTQYTTTDASASYAKSIQSGTRSNAPGVEFNVKGESVSSVDRSTNEESMSSFDPSMISVIKQGQSVSRQSNLEKDTSRKKSIIKPIV